MAKNIWDSDIPSAFQKTEEAVNNFKISVPAIEANKELERTLSLCNSDSLKAVLGVSEKLERMIPSWNSNTMESVMGMSRTIEHLLPKYTIFEQNYGTAMIKAMEQAIPRYNFDGISSALKGFSSVLEQMPKIDQQNMIDSILPQVKTAFDAWDKSAALDALANIDWSWVSETYDNKGESGYDGLECTDDFTDEIRAEMASDINQVMQNPVQAGGVWQTNYVKWKERNPFWAELFMSVLSNLIQTLICAILTYSCTTIVALANKDAKVYEEPSASSSVVYNIAIEQNITVIGDAKYYYEVEIPDPVTGESVIGYVYKGNLTVRGEKEEPHEEKQNSPTASSDNHALNSEFVLAD